MARGELAGHKRCQKSLSSLCNISRKESPGMLSKFQVGMAMAMAIAAAPLAVSWQGVVLNDGAAANGSTNYVTLQPGATKTFPMGTEIRVCHDDGPPLEATIGEGSDMTRLVTG